MTCSPAVTGLCAMGENKAMATKLRTNTICRAPKTATKRIFFITDEDDPHPGPSGHRFITSARTTLIVCSTLPENAVYLKNSNRISCKLV